MPHTTNSIVYQTQSHTNPHPDSPSFVPCTTPSTCHSSFSPGQTVQEKQVWLHHTPDFAIDEHSLSWLQTSAAMLWHHPTNSKTISSVSFSCDKPQILENPKLFFHISSQTLCFTHTTSSHSHLIYTEVTLPRHGGTKIVNAKKQ